MNLDPSRIKTMFTSIAPSYDRANDVLSFGIHRLWRRALVNWSQAHLGESVLDCATGTGDLAMSFKTKVGPNGRVLGTDFCEDMLLTAPSKAKRKNLDVDFSVADVTKLPFPNESFDIVSIGFGIRNVSDCSLALKEMARVLRPGIGRVMILEFGQPTQGYLASAYRFYSKNIVPKIGAWLTGQGEAYEYLEHSSSEFPSGERFLDMMRECGTFKKVEARALSHGIAYMYKGFV